MPEIPQAPAPEQGQPPEQGGGSASKLVAGVHTGLMQLKELLAGSQAADDGDKQALDQLIQGYMQFVDGLGSAPGQTLQGGPPQRGAAPMEAGAAQVQPAM